MYNYEDIKTIHLEVTQNCQASCPMCARNQNGGDLNPHIDLSELSLDDCKNIFKPAFIKQLKTMYMCGNLGDPIVARDTLEIFRYFREHNSNIWLSMNTNGGARNEEWWIEIAKTFDNNGMVIFSIDGLEDTNHLYRQGVNWNTVVRNAKAFISAGGNARWDFLIFDHNQHQINEAESLSKQLGFKTFTTKKSSRFLTALQVPKEKHQAVDRKGRKTTELKKPKDEYQNAALKKQNTIIEKYGSMDAYYDVVPIQCKVKSEGSLYISAEGLALPCCWTANRMYRWWLPDPKLEQIWDYIDAAGGKDALNVKFLGIKSVLKNKIFNNIETNWSKPCNSGKLKVCAMTCGIEFNPFEEQFK